MKLKVKATLGVSVRDAFLNLLAAWDYNAPPWYHGVRYTDWGDRLVYTQHGELARVTMAHPDSQGERSSHDIEIVITPAWIERTLQKCLDLGDTPAFQATQILLDSPQCDQETGDVVMQVGAYGRIVFG